MRNFVALLMFLGVAGSAAATSRPNIVFFFTDDQTIDTLRSYGHPFVETPHLDSLAARGIQFQNAFVSQSICWVSRTSILTGHTGRSFGMPDEPDRARPEVIPTIYSDLLRESGYRTGFFGKWHVKMPEGYKPEEHFDVFEDIWRNPFFKRMPDGSLRHETDLIVDRGIEFIKQQPKDKPFAINLWFNATHAEDGDRRPGIGHFTWPQSADGLYEDREMPLPRLNDPAIFEELPVFLRTSITRERFFWRWNTEDKYQTNMRAYLRMVSGIDQAIGRLLKALEDAGLADNTIIVYSADNGFHMGNRGLAGKWSHFEESLRVPLIIADPRVGEAHRGKKTDALALNLDFPSTFLDWAGVRVPEHYQGRSLKPLVEGARPTDWRTETFHEHYAVRARIPAFEGVRTERFKYARYFDHDYEFLHDLKNDPDELRNLVFDPAHADTLRDLRARTQQIVNQYGGPLAPFDEFRASTEPHPVAYAAVTIRPGPDGFVNLFNGENLNGWEGDPQLWSVEDGAITGRSDGTLTSNRFLTWKGSTVRNFDLRVKVKITAGGNSGLQYRSIMRPEIGLDIVSGYQCDIVPNNPNFNGMLYEERGRRVLSRTGEKVIVAPDGQSWIVGKMPVKEFPPDQWHEYRVLVRGNHHQHWINGHPTADLIDLDEARRTLDGVLGLQVNVGPAMTVQFKDLNIRHLPDSCPLEDAADHPIPVGSPGVRPLGRLAPDWRPPVYQN